MTEEKWFQPYRTSSEDPISIACFKTRQITPIWEDQGRSKSDLLLAIRNGQKVPLGIDSLRVPDRRVEVISHSRMIPDLDHNPTNFAEFGNAITNAYKELKGELDSIPAEYVPMERPDDTSFDLTQLIPKKQPRKSRRGIKKDLKEFERKMYTDKWTILQDTADELDLWTLQLLEEHGEVVEDWLSRKGREWKNASVDNALLKECTELDPSLYVMAQLSQKELWKRALTWRLNDIDSQKIALRAVAGSMLTFTGKEDDPQLKFALGRFCGPLVQQRNMLQRSISQYDQSIQALKQSLPNTMLSEWDVSDTSSEELEGFLKKLQEEAASLANTGVIDALNAQLKEAQASMIREKKEAAEKETLARARARQSVKHRAVPTSTRKTNPFAVFLRNFSMKDIEPLSTRQMTAEETQLEWTRPTQAESKSSLYKPPKQFKGSYDRRDTRNWQYYLKRFDREAEHDSELYRQRQEILQQRSKAVSERRKREQEAIRSASQLSGPTENKSVAEIKRTVEETWGTSLPEPAPLLEQPVWDPAKYTKTNTRPRAWNFIHQPPVKITDILRRSGQDTESSSSIAKQNVEQLSAETSEVDSDAQSMSDSQNFTITPATTFSEASDPAVDGELLEATSEPRIPYQRLRSKSIPDFRPDYIESHLNGISLAKVIMSNGTVDDSSVKDTQTYVAH